MRLIACSCALLCSILPLAALEAIPAYDAPGGSQAAQPSGFFRTLESAGRWWLIDPAGRLFFAVGTDHIRYEGHGCEKLGYAPYGKFVREHYGDEQAWATTTLGRLKQWGFNSLAAAHSPSLRHRGLPHMEFLAVGQTFAAQQAIVPQTGWTGFPDVFSPDWPRHCDELARDKCQQHKDDPWLIGYFLDNELQWYGSGWMPQGLFESTWRLPAERAAKRAWLTFLQEEFGDIESFKRHWYVDVAGFDELAGHTEPQPLLTDRAREVVAKWLGRVGELYFKTATEAIRRYDPNHLVLGCRFAGPSPGAWRVAGKYCDVVSFNYYVHIDIERGVPAWFLDDVRRFQAEAGKPLMITEWSFPALDTECPSTRGAGMRVANQAQRARCFEHFQKAMFQLPFMVGSNYFMYIDEPPEGISQGFPENSNYGLVSNRDEPYAELTEAATKLNPRVYELHGGEAPPATPAGPWLSGWMRTLQPATQPYTQSRLMMINIGSLRMHGPLEDTTWRLTVGATDLGSFSPLIRQRTPLDTWVNARDGKIVALSRNRRGTVMEVEFKGGPDAPATQAAPPAPVDPKLISGPRAYRTRWRFWMPKTEVVNPEPLSIGWFAAQCQWIENADAVPWTLAGVFPYLSPKLGGDAGDDVPLDDLLPTYYRRGGAWTDPQQQWSIGCWVPADMNFYVNWWKDEQGGAHSDVHYDPFITLQPGERYDAPDQPIAFFFAFYGHGRDDFAHAVYQIETMIKRP